MEHTNEQPTPENLPVSTPEKQATTPLTTPQAIIMNGLIIAAAIIIGSFIVAHGPFSFGSETGEQGTAAVAPDIKKVSTKGVPYIGKADASVTLAYWSDYQCPFCKQFQTTVLPSVVKEYVATGKVKVLFKDFAFLGDDSIDAALFSRAIWDLYPDHYFEWHEAMFAAQDAENAGFGDAASIKKLTASIKGVDAEKVEAAIRSNLQVYQDRIEADRIEATKFGIGGTPSFIVGKHLVPGVVGYDVVRKLIEEQL